MAKSNKVGPQEWGGELLSGFSSTLWEKQGMEYHLEVLQRKLLAKRKVKQQPLIDLRAKVLYVWVSSTWSTCNDTSACSYL